MTAARPLLSVVEINAEIDADDFFYEYQKDGRAGEGLVSRCRVTVVYVAPSEAIARLHFVETWADRHPEVKTAKVMPVDTLIEARRCSTNAGFARIPLP